jgi:glutamate 5-kinase
LGSRKRWIAGSLEPRGRLHVDAGAERALLSGRSLLPAGVTLVEGGFSRGDAVVVVGPEGGVLGRGLVAYDWDDAERICGHHSREIEAVLGYRGRDEMIHRDDLVLELKTA